MTDKQAVLETVNRLPETASFDEINDELKIIRSIKRGQADIAAGRSKSHEEVSQLLKSWSKEWTTK